MPISPSSSSPAQSDRDGRGPNSSAPSASPPGVTRTRRHLSTPTYNPGLHELILGKQQWAAPLDAAARERGFLGWHARGYLPHYDAPFTTQFVTFRLHDALPVSRRAEWEALLKIENDRERRLRLEDYIDRSHGECYLRSAPVAKLVQDALRFFDGQRYALHAWVLMPNHVHVLFNQQETPLGEILHSWRSFTAKEANKLLRLRGQFWEDEYFDTFMRDEEHFAGTVRYIESNPVKAGLARDPADWPWSSAAVLGPRASRPVTTPANHNVANSPSPPANTLSERDARGPERGRPRPLNAESKPRPS